MWHARSVRPWILASFFWRPNFILRRPFYSWRSPKGDILKKWAWSAVRLYASLAQATRPWATQTPAKKKREDIHAIDTADQSAEIPLTESTNTQHLLPFQIHKQCLWEWYTSLNAATSRLLSSHSTPSMQSRYWRRGVCHTHKRVQMPVSTVKYSPESAPIGLAPSSTTITAFGGHLWHMWAHLVTLWPLHIVCVPCGEQCTPNNSGSLNLLQCEAPYSQLWYLHTGWNSADAKSPRQCKVQASLPTSGFLSGDVLHHSRFHGSTVIHLQQQ